MNKIKELLQAIFCVFCPKPPKPHKPETLLTYHEVVDMLRHYDETRREQLIGALGFEDTRVNTFDFYELKNYLAYVEKEAKEKGIKLKGISFIKGVYSEKTNHRDDFIGYENLMYMPTTVIQGEQVLVDVINSSKEKTVTFRQMLEKNGYEWRYDNMKNFVLKAKQKVNKQEFKEKLMMKNGNEELSGTANVTTVGPPMPVK